jgi:hypothetical protein
MLAMDSLIKAVDWPDGKNWGTLSIDASCIPADINYPTDLKLLNETRLVAEALSLHLAVSSVKWFDPWQYQQNP